jgi:hypothetical protein
MDGEPGESQENSVAEEKGPFGRPGRNRILHEYGVEEQDANDKKLRQGNRWPGEAPGQILREP